jgi:hypothetical protein
VRHLGLSEVSAEEVRAAHSLHPIACVELEWSLFSREAEVGGWVVWCGCKGRWGGGAPAGRRLGLPDSSQPALRAFDPSAYITAQHS